MPEKYTPDYFMQFWRKEGTPDAFMERLLAHLSTEPVRSDSADVAKGNVRIYYPVKKAP